MPFTGVDDVNDHPTRSWEIDISNSMIINVLKLD